MYLLTFNKKFGHFWNQDLRLPCHQCWPESDSQEGHPIHQCKRGTGVVELLNVGLSLHGRQGKRASERRRKFWKRKGSSRNHVCLQMGIGSPEVTPEGSVCKRGLSPLDKEGTVSSGAGGKHEVTPFLWVARDQPPRRRGCKPRWGCSRSLRGRSTRWYLLPYCLSSVFFFFNFEIPVDSHALYTTRQRSSVLFTTSPAVTPSRMAVTAYKAPARRLHGPMHLLCTEGTLYRHSCACRSVRFQHMCRFPWPPRLTRHRPFLSHRVSPPVVCSPSLQLVPEQCCKWNCRVCVTGSPRSLEVHPGCHLYQQFVPFCC